MATVRRQDTFDEGTETGLRQRLEESTQIIEDLKEALIGERDMNERLQHERRVGGFGPGIPLVGLWILSALWMWALLSQQLQQFHISPFVLNVAMIGVGAIALEHWGIAQWRQDIVLFFVKILVLACGLFGTYQIFTHGSDWTLSLPRLAALACCALIVLMVLSPFCYWLTYGLASFIRHPIATVRDRFL